VGRTTAAACAALTAVMLPVFLVGALGDHLRRDLGLGEAGLGAVVTALFLVAAVAAPVAGRLAERTGPALPLRVGVLGAAGLAAIAATARGPWQLGVALAAVGVTIALVDTGAARAFADQIAADRLGSAFGIKEASVPTASLLAGLAVPTLAAGAGWRSAFLAAAVIAVAIVVVVPRTPSRHPARAATAVGGQERTGAASGAILVFAAGIGLGAGAATATATFLVPAMLDRGLGPTAAGLTLSVASIASIAARLTLGRWADRPAATPVDAIAVLCLAGAMGGAVLVAPVPAVVAVLAAVVVLGAGWGWTGLAFLAAVRASPAAPGTAAGTVLSGLGAGGALGPLAFGGLAGRIGYAAAWAAVAAAFLAAGATSLLARRRLAVP